MSGILLALLLVAQQTPLEEAKAALVAEDYGRARALLEALAAKGDPEGQYLLGHILDLGLGGEAKPAAALDWWLKAAKADHPMSLYRAGLAYLHARGVDPDTSRGLELLERAAVLGVHPAETAIGIALMSNARGPGHGAEALVWLACAADGGERQAAEALGLAFALGTDETLPDEIKAVRYLRLAELLGSTIAPQVLARLNPAKDVVAATEENVHLLWQAARLGFPDAQFRLAVLGLARVSWGPSPTEARKLLEAAAKNGHPEAAYRWLILRRKEGPVPDPLEVEGLLRQAAQGGFTQAAAELGRLLLARQSPEAFRWLRVALNAGHFWAALDLAEAFFTGVGGSPNAAEGFKVLATLTRAQDPDLKKRGAQLLLRFRRDKEACDLATKLDPGAACEGQQRLPSSPEISPAPSQKS